MRVMRVFGQKGVCAEVDGQRLFVDAHGKRDETILITHAHSDHAKITKSNHYLMTPATAEMIKDDLRRPEQVQTRGFGKTFEANGFGVSFHEAGHIFGSAQVKIANGSTTVVTGDLKLQKSLVNEPAEILPADVLVLEATFGKPEYAFPPREKVYEDMMGWISHNLSRNHFIVLSGYATGKAQELTKFCNEFLDETPVVHEKIFARNQACEKHGLKLGDYLKLDHNLKDANILIVPPSLVDPHLFQIIEHFTGKKALSAMSTGQPGRRGFSKVFPLSDHADFGQLLSYVQQSAPKLVLTQYGFPRELAFHIRRKLGIPARPLDEKGQKTIGEYAG